MGSGVERSRARQHFGNEAPGVRSGGLSLWLEWYNRAVTEFGVARIWNGGCGFPCPEWPSASYGLCDKNRNLLHVGALLWASIGFSSIL
jgi:hypothetical protein